MAVFQGVDDGPDTALARLLLEGGSVEADVLQDVLAEVRRRRTSAPEVSLAVLLLERRLVAPEPLQHALNQLPPRPEPGSPTVASEQEIGGYEIRAELARGGMGVVYRAHDATLDREVGLKLMLAAIPDGEDLLRFQRESRLMARLRHPNIVRLLHAGAVKGHPYLVMDLIQGRSLRDRLREGPLPTEEAVSITRTLAEAVHYAHGEGVLHRDIKPANVLLDERGSPLLTDFGLAKSVDRMQTRLTQTGEILGTPQYMSPEQAFGEHDRIGPASDVYSLGATLYAALTGRPPFDPGPLLTVLDQVVHRMPTSPRTLVPGIEPWVEEVCLRCLAKEPGERYTSARELALALEQGSRSNSASGLEHQPRGRGILPLAGAAAAGVALTLLLFSYLPTGGDGASPSPSPPRQHRPSDSIDPPVGGEDRETEPKRPNTDLRTRWTELMAKDPAGAMLLLRREAASGSGEALNLLGVCHQRGQGAPKDVVRAVEFFREAVAVNHPLAMYNLAVAYHQGVGVGRDMEQATRLYQRASALGLINASYNLGVCYELGMGVRKDPAKAFLHYQRAAKGGNLKAMTNLGICYEVGRGVERNMDRAVASYRRAAAGKEPRGMANLGILYAGGVGVPKDLPRAIELFRASARLGPSKRHVEPRRLVLEGGRRGEEPGTGGQVAQEGSGCWRPGGCRDPGTDPEQEPSPAQGGVGPN